MMGNRLHQTAVITIGRAFSTSSPTWAYAETSPLEDIGHWIQSRYVPPPMCEPWAFERPRRRAQGLPSYTEARFAPTRTALEPTTPPRGVARPGRQQRGREALRRRKRSRDFARTGRRRPCRSR